MIWLALNGLVNSRHGNGTLMRRACSFSEFEKYAMPLSIRNSEQVKVALKGARQVPYLVYMGRCLCSQTVSVQLI